MRENAEKQKSLYNPLRTDFTWNWAGENNVPQPYTIPSLGIATFPVRIADHLAKHLAQKIVLDRGVRTNYEDEYNTVLKEIEAIL